MAHWYAETAPTIVQSAKKESREPPFLPATRLFVLHALHVEIVGVKLRVGVTLKPLKEFFA